MDDREETKLLRAEAPSGTERWFHGIGFVLVMLFFVLGPLGFPLLWKSPRFAPWAKTLLTVAVLVYTVGLLRVSVDVVQRTLEQTLGALR